jgi:hypothetical protein
MSIGGTSLRYRTLAARKDEHIFNFKKQEQWKQNFYKV